MSKARAKGTMGENEIVNLLVHAGFTRADPNDPDSVGVKRFEGGYESHDICGVGGWTIEVKYRKAWHLFGWIRKIRKRSWYPTTVVHSGYMKRNGMGPVTVDEGPDSRWVIFAIHGDRRTLEGREVGRVAVMDAVMAANLIYHWENST